MGEFYSVYLGKHLVGKVQVVKEGLYYRFICRCQLSGGGMYRLFAACGDKNESLGLVVPMGDGFGIDTRIPAKRLGSGKMEFCLRPKQTISGHFVPIYPEEPFTYIENLKDGFLSIQNGQMGLMIAE